MTPIALVDLRVRGDELEELTAVIREVLERGWFILGPEVQRFEEALAAQTRTAHAVGVSSGTDALILGLRALGIGPGDEVIVPAMTAFPTAAAVLEVGATPVLVDIEVDRPLLDLDATLDAIAPATRAVVLVHLYGLAADAAAFTRALDDRGIALIEDCAQAQGALLPSGGPVGSVGAFGALSFYPTKNLAAVGDSGAVVTDDDRLAREVAAWRSHGERERRYYHELPARNARMDDLQAAVLHARLSRLPAILEHRRSISAVYEQLDPRFHYVPHGPSGAPHLAVVSVDDPNDFAHHLSEREIASGRHYPHALCDQPALQSRARMSDNTRARAWAARCVSLPLHPGMSVDDAQRVVDAVNAWPGVA